jgi:hypothetical protein
MRRACATFVWYTLAVAAGKDGIGCQANKSVMQIISGLIFIACFKPVCFVSHVVATLFTESKIAPVLAGQEKLDNKWKFKEIWGGFPMKQTRVCYQIDTSSPKMAGIKTKMIDIF